MEQRSGPSVVTVRMLGGLVVTGPDGPLHLESEKTGALLAYLALSPGAHPRAKLHGLFWPELQEQRSARNLRHALWDVRRKFQACGIDVIASGHSRIAFAPCADVIVDALELLSARDALRRGGELSLHRTLCVDDIVRGELLDGIFLDDAPEFEAWLVSERERLRTAAHEVLSALVTLHRKRQEPGAALARARDLVALDPWREDAHRSVMELLAMEGEPAAALAQFEECRRILAEQLQTAPTADTVRLAERIRGAVGVSVGPTAPPVRHNLPAQTTPFIGREREIEAIQRLLATPACRLVCLLGPGGIGKTRLALQIGLRQLFDASEASRFTDGVWFVASREGGSGGLTGALADTLLGGHPSAPGAPDLERRLVDYLRPRRILVIVDAFEHVLGEVGAVAALLEAAPLLTILVTSRELLPVDGAWTVEVSGLPSSPLGSRAPERSPAFRLFVEAARRSRFGFSPSTRDVGDIDALCRAVEGSPLAIELAGGWAGTLSVREIAREAGSHPGLLGDPAGRMHAVFTSSWNRLGAADQTALAALAVFAGGCTREAAETVAGAPLATLRRLVDSSFVRHEASGRYTIHEVLRRFSLDELKRQPTAYDKVRAAHAEFFARHVKGRVGHGSDRDEHAALDELAAELDNVQAAWRWALAAARADVVADCLGSVLAHAESRGWVRGAEILFTEAIERLDQGSSRPLIDLLVARGTLRNLTGEYGLAEADLSRALTLEDHGGEGHAAALTQLGATAYFQGQHGEARRRLERALSMASVPRVKAVCTSLLGRVALEQGRHDDAEVLFDRALVLARQAGDGHNERRATYQVGLMAYFRSDLERAAGLFEDALAEARRSGDTMLAKDTVTGLGYIHEDRAAFAEARQCYGEALAISRESGDRRSEAYSLILIGETFRRSGAFAEARRSYLDALRIAREIGSTYLVGILLANLAMMAAASGELDEAESRISQLLQDYRAGASVVTALPAVISAAEVLHRRGASRRALTLLGLVFAHPANRQDHRSEAERVLASIAAELPAQTVRSCMTAAKDLDFDSEVHRLLESGGLGWPEAHRCDSQGVAPRRGGRRQRR